MSATIVVPSRGGAARPPVMIEALRKHDAQDVERVVAPDGDIDDSQSVVKRYAGDPPVRSIVFTEIRGLAAALNTEFLDAAGDVLIRADDDLELEADLVNHHVRLHAEAPRGVRIGRMPAWPAETLVALAIQWAVDVGRRYPGRVWAHL